MGSSGRIITSADILNGTIMDADVNAAAGILGSKLAAGSVDPTRITVPTPYQAGGLRQIGAGSASFGKFYAADIMDDNILANHIAAGQVGMSELANGTRGYVIQAGATAPQYAPMIRKNRIINGGALVHQRLPQESGALAIDNTYQCADRFRSLWSGVGAAPAALVSNVYTGTAMSPLSLLWQVGAGTGKHGWFTPLEHAENRDLRGAYVSFQVLLFAHASQNDIRMAIVQWLGGPDTCSADPISAWNAAGTNPTLATNWAFAHTPVNINPNTNWVIYKVENIAIDPSMQNLGLMVWCEDTVVDTGAVWGCTDWQLEEGPVCTRFERRPFSQELALSQRYYEKSYDHNTAIGANTLAGLVGTSLAASGANNVHAMIPFKVPKRVPPSIGLYGKTGVAGYFYSLTTSVDASGITCSWAGENAFMVGNSGTASESVLFHYVATAEL